MLLRIRHNEESRQLTRIWETMGEILAAAEPSRVIEQPAAVSNCEYLVLAERVELGIES